MAAKSSSRLEDEAEFEVSFVEALRQRWLRSPTPRDIIVDDDLKDAAVQTTSTLTVRIPYARDDVVWSWAFEVTTQGEIILLPDGGIKYNMLYCQGLFFLMTNVIVACFEFLAFCWLAFDEKQVNIFNCFVYTVWQELCLFVAACLSTIQCHSKMRVCVCVCVSYDLLVLQDVGYI